MHEVCHSLFQILFGNRDKKHNFDFIQKVIYKNTIPQGLLSTQLGLERSGYSGISQYQNAEGKER